MKPRRQWTVLLTLPFLVAAVVISSAAPALGRHNFSILKADPDLVASGAEVSVTGFSYPVKIKVLIRFNALDGPVLAELEPTSNQDIAGTVRIPEGTAAGRYVLYALQYGADGKPNRIPGRAAVTVVGPGGTRPAGPTGLELEHRPATLVRSEGASSSELVLVGLGALGLAALLSLVLARVAVSRASTARSEGEAS